MKRSLGEMLFEGKMSMGIIDVEKEIEPMEVLPLYFKFYDVQHFVTQV